MIILLKTEQSFDKKQHIFMIKIFTKTGLEGSFLNSLKNIYKELTRNSILSEERVKAFLLRLRIKAGCPFFPLLFNIANRNLNQ